MVNFKNSGRHEESGITIAEVLASCVLILVGVTAIFGMNAQTLQILRRAHQAAAASQILQERIETFRTRAWPEVSRGAAVAGWWKTAADSAPDLADANPVETIVVTPASSPSSLNLRTDSFSVERRSGAVTVQREADLSNEDLLLIEVTIKWADQATLRERHLKTIVGRSGLTQSGIFGSAFGRINSTAVPMILP